MKRYRPMTKTALNSNKVYQMYLFHLPLSLSETTPDLNNKNNNQQFKQGLQLLIFGPVGRTLMGFLDSMGGHSGSDSNSDGAGSSARGAARFALATAATGHAVIALALKLMEERSSGGGGGGTAGGLGGIGAGLGRTGRGAPMSRAAGEVGATVYLLREGGCGGRRARGEGRKVDAVDAVAWLRLAHVLFSVFSMARFGCTVVDCRCDGYHSRTQQAGCILCVGLMID